MTQDEKIISMARESGIGDTGVQCGFVFFQSGAEGLKHFAALVRSDAFEEAAALIETGQFGIGNMCSMYDDESVAAAIRARGEK